MITLKKAREIALEYLNEGVLKKDTELVLITGETLEFNEGYVFSANTKKYVIDGDMGYRVYPQY